MDNNQKVQSVQQGMPVQQVPPKQTTPPQKTEEQLFSELKDEHRLALSYRLIGFRYELIAHKLKLAGVVVSEFTIRNWFLEDTLLARTYNEIKRRRIQEQLANLDDTEHQLKEGAVDAIAVLRDGLVTGTISEHQYNIAKDILDRAGFPKLSKVEQSGKIESDGLTAMANAITNILERKSPQVDK